MPKIAPAPPSIIEEKESSPAPQRSGIALPMVENKNTKSHRCITLVYNHLQHREMRHRKSAFGTARAGTAQIFCGHFICAHNTSAINVFGGFVAGSAKSF